MTATDYIFIAVALALWAAVIWHRTQARAVGELWWSCVCLAVIISLKIGVIADPFNQLTGGIYLDELMIHLVGVLMVTRLFIADNTIHQHPAAHLAAMNVHRDAPGRHR